MGCWVVMAAAGGGEGDWSSAGVCGRAMVEDEVVKKAGRGGVGADQYEVV